MKIRDLLKQQPLTPAGQSTGKVDAGRLNEQQSASAQALSSEHSSDRVTISPLAKQFQMVSKLLNEDETKSAQRVEELKAKVQSGEYQVPTRDVAQAIINNVRGVADED
jgi:flagellar biosynthesis anti-sigma factor FlgM